MDQKDRPKALAEVNERYRRHRDLRQPHMRQLVGFIDSLRRRAEQGAAVPHFDPWDGGVRAECLFLLEAPGGKAVESGFVSRNNPDETGKNFFELNQEAGLDRRRTITWNIVPWYVGSGKKIRPVKRADITAAEPYLLELLSLLPALRVAVLVGRKAQRAESLLRKYRPGPPLLACPHPSPMFVNRRPGNRGLILQVLREAAALLSR